MKRRIFILLATMLPLVASAYDAEIDGIWYNFNGDEAEVTFTDKNFSSYSGDVSVPESAIEAYRTTAPWSGFGTIVSLEATPVKSISKEAEDGITTYYDLQGRKVMNPTKGLYLMNGKKVLVK